MNEMLNASDLRWMHSLDLAISISTRMEELKISKTELADRAGMKLSSLSRIITGEQNMTLSTIAKLEYALGIRFDQGFRYGWDGESLKKASIEGASDGDPCVPSLSSKRGSFDYVTGSQCGAAMIGSEEANYELKVAA